MSKSMIEIYAIAPGELKRIEDVNDLVFAQKMMGDGFAVVPDSGHIVAPIEGQVSTVFPTEHAMGIQNSGMELLIHFGVGTVEMRGEGFESKVVVADQIRVGDLIAEIDLNLIADKGKDPDIICVITDSHQKFSLQLIEEGPIESGQKLGEIQFIS